MSGKYFTQSHKFALISILDEQQAQELAIVSCETIPPAADRSSEIKCPHGLQGSSRREMNATHLLLLWGGDRKRLDLPQAQQSIQMTVSCHEEIGSVLLCGKYNVVIIWGRKEQAAVQ